MDTSLSNLREMVNDRQAWQAVVHGVAKWNMTWWLNNNHQITSLFKVHTFYYISKVPFDMYGNIFTDFGDKTIDILGGYYYAYQIISLVFCV